MSTPIDAQPALSVVVIGRNEGARLARCLDSLQTIGGIDGTVETIYVDSGSTDGSPELAAARGAHVIALKTSRPTAAMGRNAGWAVARSELVLFLDGDTILHPDFARTARSALEDDSSLAAAWGHRREIHPEHSLYNRVLDLDWVFAPGITEYCGGDVLMRRRVLEDVGGYDPELIAGEEPELCRRIRARGLRILHLDCPMTGHDLALESFGQYWRRAVRTGHAYAEVSRKFRHSGDRLWARERLRNLTRGGFWIALALAAGIGSLAGRSVWPLMFGFGVFVVLSLRSAWRTRWKTRDWLTLCAYGVHSHLQQVPVLLGQLGFEIGTIMGRRKALIEYKRPPAG